VAEASAAARAGAGKGGLSGGAAGKIGVSKATGAASAVDIKVTWLVVGLAVIGVALVLSGAAASQTRRSLYWVHRVTEWEGPAQDFAEHLAHQADLLVEPVWVAVAYPLRTAPGITATMHQGFNPGTYQIMDPSLRGGGPREVPW
jgi:hypothetical protein